MKHALFIVLLLLTACSAPPTPSATTKVDNLVTITNFKFNPPTVTIKVGQTVEWKNEDSASHIVNLPGASSHELFKGESWAFQFTEPGTYNYACGIHPSMKGSIIVEA